MAKEMPNEPATQMTTIRTTCEESPELGLALALSSVRDNDWEVRLAAFDCLLEHGDATSSDLAMQAVHDPEESVAATAIECLVAWRHREAFSDLRRLLDSTSELMRSYSAWALGKLGVAEAEQQLVARFRPTDEDVFASAVAEALFALSGKQPYEDYLLRQLHARDPETRAFTSESLIGIAKPANRRRLLDEMRQAVRAEPMPAIREVLVNNLRRLEEATEV